jgi:hypothetical protein
MYVHIYIYIGRKLQGISFNFFKKKKFAKKKKKKKNSFLTWHYLPRQKILTFE